MDLKRVGALVGFLAGAGALILQYGLTFTQRLAGGDNPVGATIFYFVFFTIIANLMVVLVYLSELIPARWLAWWRRHSTRAMIAALIVSVFIFNHILLSGLRQLESWDLIADTLLHYILPPCFALWWALASPHGETTFRQLPGMLLFPLLYLLWAMIYGTITGFYPYPVLDAGRFGAMQVTINCVILFACFIVLFGIAIGLDRLLGRRNASA